MIKQIEENHEELNDSCEECKKKMKAFHKI